MRYFFCKVTCFSAILTLFAIFMEGISSAQNNAGLKYVRLGAGAGLLNFRANKETNFIDTSARTGFVYDISGGYYLNDKSVIDLLLGVYNKQDDIYKVYSYKFLAGYRYDFTPHNSFSPYAKVELGLTSNSLSRTNITNSSMKFITPAATLGFGISYNLSKTLFIDTGYAIQLSSLSTPSSGKAAPRDQVEEIRVGNIKLGVVLHSITFGAGFRF